MRAVQARWWGDADALATAEVPEPAPAADQVQITVHLAGVNFADVNARRGTYGAGGQTEPFGLGLEVFGEVRAVGERVRGFTVGQRVAGFAASPGYAEVAVAAQDLVWPVPDGVPEDQAAAFPIVGSTAYHLLASSARVQDGESVLVTAAAGGVGSTAIQVARLLGAGCVVGAAGTAARASAALAAGADAAVDYSGGTLSEAVRSAAGVPAVDVVLDGVGGDVRRQALDCLDVFGRLVHFGNSSGEPETLPGARELRQRNVAVVGFHLQALRTTHRSALARSTTALLEWLQDGRLHVAVADVLPLERAADAHRMLESRQVSGKLLLAPGR